jgi:hypothetical protein
MQREQGIIIWGHGTASSSRAGGPSTQRSSTQAQAVGTGRLRQQRTANGVDGPFRAWVLPLLDARGRMRHGGLIKAAGTTPSPR